ncbi:unnamed protein product, partial [Rotaria sp. Silwood2]
MKQITLHHSQLKQTLAQHIANPYRHPFMKKIDDWGAQCIEKIRKAADDARKQLQNVISRKIYSIQDVLTDMTQEIRVANDRANFVETDLKQWNEKLHQLNRNLTAPIGIDIRQDENGAPFISKVLVSEITTDIFERSTDHIRIDNRGKVAVNTGSTDHASVRCKGEYTSEQYQFRVKIEELNTQKWIFFGIMSKNTILPTKSCTSQTTYGWAGYNQVYLNSISHSNYNGYK